nr:EOG090X0N7H [Sida crystallina]
MPALRCTPKLPWISSHFVVRNNSNAAQSAANSDPDLPAEDMTNPYEKEKRQCILCKYNITVDYKNPRLLSQFVSSFTGKLYDRNITGLCKKQHEALTTEITKSQTAGYMPVMIKKVQYFKDPKICDPNRPVRPHRF